MGRLKAINRSAVVSWSPLDYRPGLLAAGSVAGSLDLSFSASSTLEIFDVDFSSDNGTLNSIGKIESDVKFQKLAWSPVQVGSGTESLGLLVGGMEDGSVRVWDASKLTRYFCWVNKEIVN
jgi:protein transport protein SEC31